MLRRIRDVLSRRDQIKLILVGCAILLMAFLEVVGIGSILPFMTLVAEPDRIADHQLANRIFGLVSITEPRSMIVAAGVVVLLLLVLANVVAALTMWFQYRTSWNIAHRLATRLVNSYIREPYQFFLNTNSADLIKKVVPEVNTLTTGVLVTGIELVARGLVSLVIFGLLFAVNAPLALAAIVLLGGTYVLIFLSRKTYLERLGQERLDANLDRFKALNELLTGIKALKVTQAGPFFYSRYERASRRVTSVHPKFQMVSLLPKYIIECVAFGSVIALTVIVVARSGSVQESLPLLSLFALAGYRLIPSLQSVFVSAARLRHSYPVVDNLYNDLSVALERHQDKPGNVDPIRLKSSIVFDDVSFTYEGSDQDVIRNFDLEIPKGTTVAFVGSTGSGKTTVVDMLTGLLEPTSGSILIDGRRLDAELVRSWQRILGYVPQDVFLFDDTVYRNIAFGVPDDEIDKQLVRRSAEQANLSTFIENELSSGYESEVGERGARISGGQRQRMGLARAFYQNPEVLILDEATSALDGITEEAVMKTIAEYGKDLTVIIIAHRLSTVKDCDQIFLLEEGRVSGSGTFEELVEESEVFRQMASL